MDHFGASLYFTCRINYINLGNTPSEISKSPAEVDPVCYAVPAQSQQTTQLKSTFNQGLTEYLPALL